MSLSKRHVRIKIFLLNFLVTSTSLDKSAGFSLREFQLYLGEHSDKAVGPQAMTFQESHRA